MWSVVDKSARPGDAARRFAETYWDVPRTALYLQSDPAATTTGRIFYTGTFRVSDSSRVYRLRGSMSGEWSVDVLDSTK